MVVRHSLFLAFALPLAACGEKSEPADTQNDEPSEPTATCTPDPASAGSSTVSGHLISEGFFEWTGQDVVVSANFFPDSQGWVSIELVPCSWGFYEGCDADGIPECPEDEEPFQFRIVLYPPDMSDYAGVYAIDDDPQPGSGLASVRLNPPDGQCTGKVGSITINQGAPGEMLVGTLDMQEGWRNCDSESHLQASFSACDCELER